ncbi:MAG: hypothetical protein ACYCTL_09425 [Acidimicrobiales bacterium]
MIFSMADPNAELSSLTTALDDITRRIAALAGQAASAHDDAGASELFSVERALRGAVRRLGRLGKTPLRQTRA